MRRRVLNHVVKSKLQEHGNVEFETEIHKMMLFTQIHPEYAGWLNAAKAQYLAQEAYETKILSIIDEVHPDFIINTADQNMLGRSTAHAAYRHQVPTVTWIVSIAGTHPTLDVPVSDYAVMGGNPIAEYYIQRGYPREHVALLGYPWLDCFTPMPLGTKIMFATENCCLKKSLLVFKELVEVCNRSHRTVMLRVHPKENPSPWFNAIKNEDVEIIVGPRSNVELLRQCSHVLVNQSGLGLEALLTGRHLVVYQNGRRMFIDFLTEKAATPFNSDFLNAPEPSGVRESIVGWNTSNDGQASKRIVNFLENHI